MLMMFVVAGLPMACMSGAEVATVEADRDAQQVEMMRLEGLIVDGQGDALRGRELFASRCGNCHQLFDTGTASAAAPDLTPYKRDREAIPSLLEKVAFPDAELHPYHAMFEISTRDGRVLSGVMTERDEDELTLVNVAGRPITLERDNITEERPLYTSMMPAHLITSMTDQQVVDLFTFLLADTQPE